jgi:UDP-glucose 4-epimerase
MRDIHLVIGGFGFIGHQLIKRLLVEGEIVFCVDDNSAGNFEYSILEFENEDNFNYILGDINCESTKDTIVKKIKNHKIVVWHLAANSDIQAGSSKPKLDAQKTFMTSVSVCEMSKKLEIHSINFASTSAVYGELLDKQIFTELSTCNPISYYGIAKYSSEKFLELSALSSGIPLLIFRFANIVGKPATHGVLFDLINRMKSNPNTLKVLGNGEQTKSYLHVDDLIEMMFTLWAKKETGVFNLGPGDHGISVSEIVNLLVQHIETPVRIIYDMNPRGWNGDAVRVLMSTEKFMSIFKAGKLDSFEAVHKGIHDISQQLDFNIICSVSKDKLDRN